MKVSEIVRTEAHNQFLHKRQEIIHNRLKDKKLNKDIEMTFQERLNAIMNKN